MAWTARWIAADYERWFSSLDILQVGSGTDCTIRIILREGGFAELGLVMNAATAFAFGHQKVRSGILQARWQHT
jgi:hypothetical protein